MTNFDGAKARIIHCINEYVANKVVAARVPITSHDPMAQAVHLLVAKSRAALDEILDAEFADIVQARCSECGKTSTRDGMWALYCVECIETKIGPALYRIDGQ